MNGDVKIDVGGLLPYLEHKLRGLFGKDAESVGWAQKIKDMARRATEHAAFVQCIGMHTPIPIERIYQPSRVRRFSASSTLVRNAGDLLSGSNGSLVFAGPGQGKTTLLHSLYMSLAAQKDRTPVLFTLRWEGAVGDLGAFVDRLAQHGTKQELVLLVDGYDEVSEKEREEVSRALLLFTSLERGPFILTCRTLYTVYDIKCDKCDHYLIEPFSEDDALQFVKAFCSIYAVELPAEALIAELNDRGFHDFITHPLMLTLVCILKTGQNQDIPRRAIGLVRRAIEVLTFRWDEGKRVHRQSVVPLDGEERVRCLMHVAFHMKKYGCSYEEIIHFVREHLRLVQLSKVDPAQLLDEMARWYGIVVPVENSRWQFVHRTIHDFLAARYWVESGVFASERVNEWTVRTAYAICLSMNPTEMIVRLLQEAPSLEAFSECLYNHASFDVSVISEAVIRRAWGRGIFFKEGSQGLEVEYEEDPCVHASPDFLRALIIAGSDVRFEAFNGIAMSCWALGEMQRRGIKINGQLLKGRLGDLVSVNPYVILNRVLSKDKVPNSEQRFRLAQVTD